MGGKTQQRVAGNAKPTNSGRIRDLMINKQQSGLVGNIVTFGALANGPKLKPSTSDAKADEGQLETNLPKRDGQERLKGTESAIDEPIPSVAPKDQQQPTKQTLVVKRVGNRDYFTRVRLPQDEADALPLPSTTTTTTTTSQTKINEQVILADEEKQDEEIPKEQEEEETSSDTQSDDTFEDNQEVDFDSILSKLSNIQDDCEQRNNSSTLNEFSFENLNQECELIRLLRILIREFREDLSIEEWDLIVRSIYKWCNLITKTEHLLQNDNWTNFCKSVFNFISLLIELAKIWNDNMDNKEENDKFPMMNLLLNDWNNFHSSNVYQDLIILYFKLIDLNETISQAGLIVLDALAKIIVEVDPIQMVTNANLKDYSNASIEFDNTDLKLLANCRYCKIDQVKFKGFTPIINLLNSNYRIIVVTAHSMLSKVMPTISSNVRESLENKEDELDNVSLLPPAILMSILNSKDLIMSALLSDYRVGDISVTIEPNTDAYTCTLSYLFVWDLIIQFIVGMNKENQPGMIHSLKKLNLLQRLLDNIFMLLPPLDEKDSLRFDVDNVKKSKKLSCQSSMKTTTTTATTMTKDEKFWSLIDFLKSPLRTNLKRPKNEIELVALHLYFSIASHMPVTVRKWYNNNSNKRLCNLVNEYTAKHVSQVICSLEMERVQEKCQERASDDKYNNLIVKARLNAKEVYAIYTRDEFKMELTIKLPVNYPLGSVQIDGGKRVGVTDLKWRSWLLQLTTFLSHQNGPILDGIDLWRKNIDKRFEGIEKCMICFSILHSNYQLPKKKCTTCTKMFHNLCLYKWFESSGNSTCPLCRNTW